MYVDICICGMHVVCASMHNFSFVLYSEDIYKCVYISLISIV